MEDVVGLVRELGPTGVLITVLVVPSLRRLLKPAGRVAPDDGETRGRMLAQLEQVMRDLEAQAVKLQSFESLMITYQSGAEKSAQERHREVLAAIRAREFS